MNLVILIQDEHKPIPRNIDVIQNYGSERIRLENGEYVVGESVFLSGEEKDFQDWLRPFAGVWISTNPVGGTWEVVHIK